MYVCMYLCIGMCVCIHVYVCMHNILGELSGANVLLRTGGGIVRGIVQGGIVLHPMTSTLSLFNELIWWDPLIILYRRLPL